MARSIGAPELVEIIRFIAVDEFVCFCSWRREPPENSCSSAGPKIRKNPLLFQEPPKRIDILFTEGAVPDPKAIGGKQACHRAPSSVASTARSFSPLRCLADVSPG